MRKFKLQDAFEATFKSPIWAQTIDKDNNDAKNAHIPKLCN